VLEKYPGKVRLLFKNFPLRNHKLARPAAMAALAAENQGRFWEYHDKIFENYRNISEKLLSDTARDMGLNIDQFEKDRKDIKTSNIINRDLQEGNRIGVRGTPTIFINGKRLGQRSLTAFSTAIESELEAASSR
jgi:protein-disulfide isomerase